MNAVLGGAGRMAPVSGQCDQKLASPQQRQQTLAEWPTVPKSFAKDPLRGDARPVGARHMFCVVFALPM
jgi:hypothetical protein